MNASSRPLGARHHHGAADEHAAREQDLPRRCVGHQQLDGRVVHREGEPSHDYGADTDEPARPDPFQAPHGTISQACLSSHTVTAAAAKAPTTPRSR